MKKLYLTGIITLALIVSSLLPKVGFSQACNTLTATYRTTESRCAASGSIQINVSGGSSNYEYKVSGPVNTIYTPSNIIIGLPAGNYLVSIQDIGLRCFYERDTVTVDGGYRDPNFTLTSTPATCIGIGNGSITVASVKFGRPPFIFEIVTPSVSGIGTVSTTGNFTGLMSGNYFIQLTDSCGTTVVKDIVVQNLNGNCCDSLIADYITTESRCEATGTVQIDAKGGSGNYLYMATGPVSTPFTSSNLISGLSPGRYLITVKDIVTGCEYAKDSITIDGDYIVPNFTLDATDVTCPNGSDGTITVISQQYGRAPFSYKIIAPSASGIGTVSVPGIFTGLINGNYFIQLSDSCGAIQTRNISIQNYDWIINNYTVTKITCDSIAVTINLKDIKGNVTPHPIFNGFFYGASVTPGDTTWFTTNSFKYYTGNKNTVKLFVKDLCGNIKSVSWTGLYPIPSVSPVIAMSNMACSTFTATVTGQINLTAPLYCIYDSSAALITCNATGVFNLLPYGTYRITIKNSCYDTTIIRTFTGIKPIPSVNLNVQTSCNDFTVTVTGQQNLYNPNYCLYDSADVLIACDSTGVFQNLPFGNYCIKIINDPACYDTTIIRCFTANRLVPSVDATVTITNLSCSTFTASVTGQTNLFNPTYCLYAVPRVLITCNTTGVFDSLPYGSYCIDIISDSTCYDTTITRCFTVNRPVPSVAPNVLITNLTCTTFTATIEGQINTSNPQYCLYTPAHVLIMCNSTGVFNNLPYGSYCIDVINDSACYDTTIVRCFTVGPPIPSMDAAVTISNRGCTNFTATVTGQVNLSNPQYCLYTPAHVLIICNSTGVFNNIPYGSYCIDVVNDSACYDTTIVRCFTATRPIPSVDALVKITNKACLTFTASVTGQVNISNAQYCIYDNLNVLLSCNTTGVFTNLSYGSYCIKVVNDSTCYDTLINRCFVENVPVADISVSARKSCSVIGTSNLRVTINSGIPSFTILLYSPSGTLLQTATTSSTTYTFANMPQLATPLQYKIVITDQCGSKDSVSIAPVISVANRVITITPKCPSGVWPNGSSDIIVNINDNNIGGNIIPKIIKKDGVSVSINASLVTGYKYTFLDLGPATYVFDTYIEDCNKHLYDTVVVRIYIFPILSGSNAYQCDNNGFSVNVNVAGGIGPYTYEIIGSVPASPSIVTAPQASPVFSINNGTTYSLIRLRVTDGCGNASLYDVSVLPLGNFLVFANAPECFNTSISLIVDSIANATYTWYKRIVPNDSMIVGTGSVLNFPNLTIADTGRYFCRIVVNNGCLIRYANYILTGICGGVLPTDITLSGAKQTDGHKLFWNEVNPDVSKYDLQRSTDNTVYKTIKSFVNITGSSNSFTDKEPFTGNNFYRLKIITANNTVKYSNTVLIKNTKFDITLYPNPVKDKLFILLKSNTPKNYAVEINNVLGQKIAAKIYYNIQNRVVEFERSAAVSNGIYTVTVIDLSNNEKETYRVIYR
ncbi:T9SS type A sorting domain-containing protein [Ferruginibacter sp.]